MVFNWFRRQYSESESSEKETPEKPQDESAKSAPVEPQTDAAVDESSPAVAEDYLNWAKAAYKNIQKQQKPEAEVPEVAESIAIAVMYRFRGTAVEKITLIGALPPASVVSVVEPM